MRIPGLLALAAALLFAAALVIVLGAVAGDALILCVIGGLLLAIAVLLDVSPVA